MKAIKLVFVAALTAVVLMLTSCMGDKGNKYSGDGIGMIKYDADTQKALLFGLDIYPLYSAGLQQYALNNRGVYAFVSVSYDLDSPENANYTQKGYKEAAIQVLATEEDMAEGRVNYYSEFDTETPEENEVKTIGLDLFGILDNKLLSAVSISNYTKEDKIDYKMECNIEQTPGTNNSLNVYDFYLRTSHIAAGSSGSTYGEYVVFDLITPLSRFKSQEANSNKKSFYVRFNYATTVEEDNIMWKQSPLMEVSTSNN